MSSAPPDLDAMYAQPPPPFGRALLAHYTLDPEYTALNNGSYGTTPRPVQEAAKALADRVEANPDLFHRLTYQGTLKEARAQLAALVNVHADELVLVSNATTGVNVVLRNLDWSAGDQLIAFSTSYAAVSSTVHYLADVPPHPRASFVPLAFPCSPASIVDAFRAHLRLPENQAAPNSRRVAVIDSIVSNPGIALPWKELVEVCREEGVLSVVDAAHSIGQEPDIDLAAAQPDFWVSNCHKWLMAKRSSAVLYIPFRNQHLIKTSLPTSNFYRPLALRKGEGEDNLQVQFEWTGTQDLAPFFSILDALRFRKWLGGEHAINEHCHALALAGGKYLAELWGTALMDPSGESTLNMVNIALPIPADAQIMPGSAGARYIERRLLVDEKAYSAWFFHNGRFWTRCSAQVFNDMSDFERLGKAWTKVAAEVREKFAAPAPGAEA